MDYWIQLCEALPVPHKETATIANAIMPIKFSRHRCLLSVLSAEGHVFDNKLFKEFSKVTDTWKVWTSLFHPGATAEQNT